MEDERFNPENQESKEISPFDKARREGKVIGNPNESEITEYKEDERWFVRKRLKHNKVVTIDNERYMVSGGQYVAKDVEGVYEKRRRFYGLLKKYLGDYLIDTKFTILKDSNNEMQIYLDQEFVDGDTIAELIKGESNEIPFKDFTELPLPENILKQLEVIDRIFIEQIQHDPEIIAEFKDEPSVITKSGKKVVFGDCYSPLRYAYDDILPHFILLHPDSHGDWNNIIVTKDGGVKIIDW